MEYKNLRILIAEDNATDRLILETIVKKQGHIVYSVADGCEAVEAFKKEKPDLILLDALMPNKDGFEAAREIKEIAGEDLVPIIFLTSLKDVTSLADCLSVGGDDFLTKPYNRAILHAKIQAFARMRSLHATVQSQRDEISLNNKHMIQEQEVAKAVFDNIAHPGCINASNIKCLLSPMAIFNGDMVLAVREPSGGMYVMLGDFTGHGLPAAIGAMPAAEIFYGMAKKGFSAQDILREVNKKLKSILPPGFFCCACMVEMDFHKGSAKIWVGGLPDIYIYKHATREVVPIKSSHLALGVLSDSKFNSTMEYFEMDYNDRIYLWSDGIHESNNAQGEMFGTEELDKVFAQNKDANQLFAEILKSVETFTGNSAQSDDYTIVEVTRVPEEQLEDNAVDAGFLTKMNDGPEMDWTLTYELRPASLRTFNPLPLLTHILMEIPGLRPHSTKLYTILAELYSNALEHGLMELSSTLKSSPAGFAEYYRKREEQLQLLHEGKIIFILSHKPTELGGELSIQVKDSGAGFDYQHNAVVIDSEHRYCGRGVHLIKTLCKSFRYTGVGNEVEAVFEWSYSGKLIGNNKDNIEIGHS